MRTVVHTRLVFRAFSCFAAAPGVLVGGAGVSTVGLATLAQGEVSVAAAADQRSPLGRDEGLFAYRFERGDLLYADILTLANGGQRTGKVLEWANQILLFDADGDVSAYPMPEVALFETRRRDRHNARPNLPDLTVAFVERLPRDPNWHGHVLQEDGLSRLDIDPNAAPWHPEIGAPVEFRVHILNAGANKSTAVPCRVLIDGGEVMKTQVRALDPGGEHVVAFSWRWQEGQHTLHVEIDADGRGPEIVRWNNRFTEPVRALGVSVVVARQRYEAFKRTPNLVDSFCIEDYIQYHMRTLNALFAASVYPSAPEGIVERVRCDRIIVVDDPADESARSHWAPMLWRDGKTGGLAEYAALLTLGKLGEEEDLPYDALKVDWRLLKRIGLQIGLVDLRKTDTTLEQCYVFTHHGRYAQRRNISPWIRSLMHTAAGFPFTEPEAAYLNRTIGRPRGFRGDYLYQLPKKIAMEVLSNIGTPLEGVQIDVFQLQAEGPNAGKIKGIGRIDPLISAVTNRDGRAELVNLPAPSCETPAGYRLEENPYGKIRSDGSNGLLLLRLRSRGAEEFHFLPLYRLNIAFRRGHSEEDVHPVETRFGVLDAPPAPPHAGLIMPGRSGDKPPLVVTWMMPEVEDTQVFDAFRIYKKTGFAGDEIKPWTLASIVRQTNGRWIQRSDETYFDEFVYDGPYSLDTFFAVSMVDTQGRESNLSEPSYLPYEKECLQFALDGVSGYMTLRGEGPVQLLYWDGVAGTQPYSVKTDRLPGYTPSFEGIAFTADHRMVVTDPRNHVLAIYEKDRHELIEVIPQRDVWPGVAGTAPGEFSDPADVAVDDAGNLYVADRGNNRVQILDARGRFKSLLDADFRFHGPHAVGFANGRLCITDKGGTRCRIYDVSGAEPKYVVELPPLFGAGRAMVNEKGEAFITGRIEEDGKWSVHAFRRYGDEMAWVETISKGMLGSAYNPRGLYWFRGINGLYAYYVNQFPFDVRRVTLKTR